MSRNFLRKVVVSLDGQSGATVTGGGNTDLRIQFSVEQWSSQTTNKATIRIYNPSPNTRQKFQNKEFSTITLSAGYNDNCGRIFNGNVLQSIAGHENATDTYVDIFAADGDNGYVSANVTKTLAAGWTPKDKVQIALDAFAPHGITMGLSNVDLSTPAYPRGRAFIGMARDLIRQVALEVGATWSIQNGQVCIIDPKKPIPGSAVTLTAATGLVGWPRQTESGIYFQSLINPELKVHANVMLDPSQIIEAERNNNPLANKEAQAGNLVLDQQALGAGTYNIFKINRVGDTRGQEWYDECFCVGVSGSVIGSSAQAGYYISPN